MAIRGSSDSCYIIMNEKAEVIHECRSYQDYLAYHSTYVRGANKATKWLYSEYKHRTVLNYLLLVERGALNGPVPEKRLH